MSCSTVRLFELCENYYALDDLLPLMLLPLLSLAGPGIRALSA